MFEDRIHQPPVRPAYLVQTRNNGEVWRRRSAWYALADAIKAAEDATQERGYMLWPLNPHVRIINREGDVLAAWRLGKLVIPPSETPATERESGHA